VTSSLIFNAFSSSFETNISTSSCLVIVGGVVPHLLDETEYCISRLYVGLEKWMNGIQDSGLQHWCMDWTWKIGLLINIASEGNDMGKLM
jgi:hypothetical protein